MPFKMSHEFCFPIVGLFAMFLFWRRIICIAQLEVFCTQKRNGRKFVGNMVKSMNALLARVTHFYNFKAKRQAK